MTWPGSSPSACKGRPPPPISPTGPSSTCSPPGHDNHGSSNGQAADSPPKHPCVLIDLALVHSGHWMEDALYLERQFWGHEPLLHGVKPLPMLAKLRRERGLPTDDHYSELAN